MRLGRFYSLYCSCYNRRWQVLLSNYLRGSTSYQVVLSNVLSVRLHTRCFALSLNVVQQEGIEPSLPSIWQENTSCIFPFTCNDLQPYHCCKKERLLSCAPGRATTLHRTKHNTVLERCGIEVNHHILFSHINCFACSFSYSFFKFYSITIAITQVNENYIVHLA